MADDLDMVAARRTPDGRPTLYRVWRAARLVGVVKVLSPRTFQPMATSHGRWIEGPKVRSRPKALEWLNDTLDGSSPPDADETSR